MAMLKKYRLSDNANAKNVDLRQYKDEIEGIIDEVAPGKNPKVYKDHFTTDQLTHSEAVRIGRALSKSGNLAAFGKTVTTFRLFSGSTVEVEDRPKGGRMR